MHPLHTGLPFFSRILLGIRRLAALTRSPVPIDWMADGRARGKSQSFSRSLLDVVGLCRLVVGCWMLDVGCWILGGGRLNPPRHARIASQFVCPSSRRRNPPLTPPRRGAGVRQTFGPACRLSSRLEPWAAFRSRQL